MFESPETLCALSNVNSMVSIDCLYCGVSCNVLINNG
jgi:biotin synthase-like enzyme